MFRFFFAFPYRFSWIHLDDIVNLIYEALSNPSYKGKLYTPLSQKQDLSNSSKIANKMSNTYNQIIHFPCHLI